MSSLWSKVLTSKGDVGHFQFLNVWRSLNMIMFFWSNKLLFTIFLTPLVLMEDESQHAC